MPAKRRLEDLYVVGKELTIDDGQGEVQVWLQKLNPVDSASALRRANMARAKVRTVRRDKQSDEYLDMWIEVLEWDDQATLIEYLVAEDLMRVRERVEAELAAEDEWAKDDYLQGLRDAWESGLNQTYFTNPNDVDAKRVYGELERFGTEAEARGKDDIDAARAKFEVMEFGVLQEKAFDRVISYRGSAAWLEEYHRSELLYGVREAENHKAYYFKSPADIDQLSAEVLGLLYREYAALSVDVMEGKDSEETPDSSASSEPPIEAETGVSSGLAVVGR
jgi:hypothetical protein